jgi:hypothetical protein
MVGVLSNARLWYHTAIFGGLFRASTEAQWPFDKPAVTLLLQCLCCGVQAISIT